MLRRENNCFEEIERFCISRPQQPTLSDEENQSEVIAVSYGK